MKKRQLRTLYHRALSLALVVSTTASLCFAVSGVTEAMGEQKDSGEVRQEEASGERHHHTFACYEEYELACTENHEENEHRESCYIHSGELVCGLEDGELHVHGPECEVAAKVLVCEETEEEETEEERPQNQAGESSKEENTGEEAGEESEDAGEESGKAGEEAGENTENNKPGEESGENDRTEEEETGELSDENGKNEEDAAGESSDESGKNEEDTAEESSDGSGKSEEDVTGKVPDGSNKAEENETGKETGGEEAGEEKTDNEKTDIGETGREETNDGESSKEEENSADKPAENVSKDDSVAGSGNGEHVPAGREEAEGVSQTEGNAGDAGSGAGNEGNKSDAGSGTGENEGGMPSGEIIAAGAAEPGKSHSSLFAMDKSSRGCLFFPRLYIANPLSALAERILFEEDTAVDKLPENASDISNTSDSDRKINGHQHTEDCYKTIYRCRGGIAVMALREDGIEVTNGSDLLKVINNAEANKETKIYVTQKINTWDTASVSEGKRIIIDLCGNTITHYASQTLFDISGGSLDIIDSESQSGSISPKVKTRVKESGEASYDADTGILTYYVTESEVNLDGKSTTDTVWKYVVDFGIDDIDTAGAGTGAVVSNKAIDSLITVTGGTLTVKGGRLTNPEGKHGILMSSKDGKSGTVNIEGGYIVGNGKDISTNVNGGGIEVDAGTLNVRGGVIAANKALRGGGIYTKSMQEVNIDGGVISGNEALQGGAVYADNGTVSGAGRVNINGGILFGNKVTANGGAVYALNSRIIVSGEAALVGNAARETGGAIRLTGSLSELWISGGYIAGNTAGPGILNNNAAGPGNGGGVYMEGVIVSLSNGVIAANNANGTESNGGGLYINDVATYANRIRTEINYNTVIAGNTANADGGGIYLADSNPVEQAAASSGTGGKSAEDIQASANKIKGNVKITNNHAKNNGGGIYLKESSISFSESAEVIANTADGEGDAIYYTQKKETTGGSETTVSKITITGNVKITSGKKRNSIYATGNGLEDIVIDPDSNCYIEQEWESATTGVIHDFQELKTAVEQAKPYQETIISLGSDLSMTESIDIAGKKNIVLLLNHHDIAYRGSGQYLFAVKGINTRLTIKNDNDGKVISPQVEALGETAFPDIDSQHPESLEHVGQTGEYNSAEQKINYYVTESNVAPDGITTKETRYKYTIGLNKTETGTGTLKSVAPIDAILYADGGSYLDIYGGIITNPGNSAVHINGSTVNMYGGYIINSGDLSKNNVSGIYAENGSSVAVKNGVIAANKAKEGGGICVKDGQRVEITGGVITGNEADNQGGGLSVEGSGARVFVGDNAVIAGNRANIEVVKNTVGWGGNRYSQYYGGGGIFTGIGVSLDIGRGCRITNNRVEKQRTKYEVFGGGGTGGGGVFALGNLNIGGGCITANFSQAAAGGVYSNGAGESIKVTMHGGMICGNYACNDEGGGLRIDTYGELQGSKENKIYIANNRTDTSTTWGGGGIFNKSQSKVIIQNVLITKNTAEGFGGGMAGCNHGTNQLFVQGGAVFDNKANGNPDKSKKISGYDKEEPFAKYANGMRNFADHVDARTLVCQEGTAGDKTYEPFIHFKFAGDKEASYQDFYCSNISQIYDKMLGGGSAHWRGSKSDSDKLQVYPEAYALKIEEGGSADACNMMGLTAHPDDRAKADAKNAAEICITGNYSKAHGAGVMSNGTFKVKKIEGNDFNSKPGKLVIKKEVRNVTGSSVSGNEKFSFTISFWEEGENEYKNLTYTKDPVYSDDEKADGSQGSGSGIEVSLRAGQTITFDGLPTGQYQVVEKDTNNYIVYIRNEEGENVREDTAEGTLWGDQTKTITFINEPKPSIIVKKEVQDGFGNNIETHQKFNFTLKLTDEKGGILNGQYTYIKEPFDKEADDGEAKGTISLVDGEAPISLRGGQSISVYELPDGALYQIIERPAENGDFIPKDGKNEESGTIKKYGGDTITFVNVPSSPLPVYPVGSLRIKKELQDQNGAVIDNDAHPFTFAVKLTDAAGDAVTGEYPFVKVPSDSAEGGESSEGKISFVQGGPTTITLRGGQSMTIRELPAGTVYQVTEQEDAQKNTPYKVKGEAQKNGEILENQEVVAAFVNVYEPENPNNPDEPDKPDEPDNPDEPNKPDEPSESESTKPSDEETPEQPSDDEPSGSEQPSGEQTTSPEETTPSPSAAPPSGGGGRRTPNPPTTAAPSSGTVPVSETAPVSETEPATETLPVPETSPDPNEGNPGMPPYPTELPDPNDPNSPDTVTIMEDDVPRTYIKVWDPETEEYIYLPEDEVPRAAMLPKTGDHSGKGLWKVMFILSLISSAVLFWLKRMEERREENKQLR